MGLGRGGGGGVGWGRCVPSSMPNGCFFRRPVSSLLSDVYFCICTFCVDGCPLGGKTSSPHPFLGEAMCLSFCVLPFRPTPPAVAALLPLASYRELSSLLPYSRVHCIENRFPKTNTQLELVNGLFLEVKVARNTMSSFASP